MQFMHLGVAFPENKNYIILEDTIMIVEIISSSSAILRKNSLLNDTIHPQTVCVGVCLCVLRGERGLESGRGG